MIKNFTFLSYYVKTILFFSTANGDYINSIQNITFDNADSRNFSVALVDNNIAESDESFEVFLQLIPDSPYDVILGEPSVATVIINDDEVPSENPIMGYHYTNVASAICDCQNKNQRSFHTSNFAWLMTSETFLECYIYIYTELKLSAMIK